MSFLTLEIANKSSCLPPLHSYVEDERRVSFTVVIQKKYTLLQCGFIGVRYKKVTPRKWLFLELIERAQESYWGYNKYHRKFSRTNLLFYTVTLRNVGLLILHILDPTTNIISSMAFEKIDDNTQHLLFAVQFPKNSLISEKQYRIVQRKYIFNYSEYIATCIEFIGLKPTVA